MLALQKDRLLLATLALCVLLLGVWTVSQETAQYWTTGTKIQRVAAMPDHAPFAGLSLTTRQDDLMDCLFALQRQGSLEVRFISEAFRSSLPARCSAMALDAVQRMPTYSYAWFVLAYTEAITQDWAAMNQHLQLSQGTGPASQWVAEQRVALAESHRDHLDEASLAGNDADLAMLVLSQRGIRSIASRYVDDPSFRERITLIVETMPDEIQRRFLTSLHNVMQ